MSDVQNAKPVAVVTGASRGLGRATAIRLARDGFAVVVHYGSNQAAADEVVYQIEQEGGTAFALQADVSQTKSIAEFFQQLDVQLRERFGTEKFDVLVNNAGIIASEPLEDMEEEVVDRLFAINVKGLLFMTHHASSRLRDGGRIINLGTGITRFAMPQYLAYAATKGAVDVITQNLAKHLGPRGITVNTIAPGATETDMTEQMLSDEDTVAYLTQITTLGRVGEPEDIADSVSFLASNDSRWVTAQRLEVSGGMLL